MYPLDFANPRVSLKRANRQHRGELKQMCCRFKHSSSTVPATFALPARKQESATLQRHGSLQYPVYSKPLAKNTRELLSSPRTPTLWISIFLEGAREVVLNEYIPVDVKPPNVNSVEDFMLGTLSCVL